jgi:nucleoside-diphosphate-sugar epimerase
MNLLITGNMGYVGTVLTKYLRDRYESLHIVGFDTGYFGHCLTNSRHFPECRVDVQHMGDLRRFPIGVLQGVDAVVHLAAISNDPIGNRFEAVTRDINVDASRGFAAMAKEAGVRHFIFSSSCSLYGAATGKPRKEDDELNPISAYAQSKAAMEEALADLQDRDFKATCLRFATACGMSERLRLDLVFNDFVASALLTGIIEVLSDGTPWRPLVHVRDMARAIEWAIHRDYTAVDAPTVVNVGCDEWTFQMGKLASEVAKVIPHTVVDINDKAQPDKRSYKVDFTLFKKIAPDCQPVVDFAEAVFELCEGLKGITFPGSDFRKSELVRLQCLEKHIEQRILTDSLYWNRGT